MNQQYPLLPISLFVGIAYLITFYLSRASKISKSAHRKIWNVLLLVTFFVAGIIGIFAVIKINYKFSFPLYDTLLTWHVDFGIGMFIISIFHFSWHLNYYVNLFRGNREKKTTKPKAKKEGLHIKIESKYLYLLMFLLGFITLLSQILFFREFIVVVSGNEFVTAILLASWLLITALGAYFGKLNRRVPFTKLLLGFFALTILPGIMIFLLYLVRNSIFPPGVLIQILGISVLSLLFLLPFCFLSGWLFNSLSTILSEQQKRNLIAHAYGIESAGSVLGGLLFSLVLVYFLNTYQVLGVMLLISAFIIAFIAFRVKNKHQGIVYLITGTVLGIALVLSNTDLLVKSLIFKNQEVLKTKDTPYGNITLTKSGDEKNIFENGQLMQSASDFMTVEEMVHFAMVQHPEPKRVFIFSGNLELQLKELKKYRVEAIDYLELNPEILKMKDVSMSDSIVSIIHDDPIKFLKSAKKKYDVLILNSPTPSTLESNRFFSNSFFSMAKQHGNVRSILITSLPSSLNYLGIEGSTLHSVLFNTMKQHYMHVLLLQGEKNYFLASDGALTAQISGLVDEKNIENQYVNHFYLPDEYLQQRSDFLMGEIDDKAPVNTIFNLAAFKTQLKIWLSYFQVKYKIVVLILSFVFLFLFVKSTPADRSVLTGGFTASAAELIIIFAFQVFFGNMYQMLGLIFALFMAGLSLGVFLVRNKNIDMTGLYKQLSLIQYLLGGVSVLLAIVLFVAHEMELPHAVVFSFLILITLVLSTLVGVEFKTASQLSTGSYAGIAARVYGFDLIGAAFGAFLVALVLIPWLGILKTCLVLLLLNLISGSMVWFQSWEKNK